MAEQVKYVAPIKLYHHNSNVKTIQQFLERERVYEDKQNGTGISAEEFFETNRTNILVAMTLQQKLDFQKQHGLANLPLDSDLTIDMELPCPCVFVIDAHKVTNILAISQTNALSPYDDVDALIDIKTQDLSYRRWLEDKVAIQYANQNEWRHQNALYKTAPHVTAFGWSKSAMFLVDRNGKPEDNAVQQAFFDFTPFIMSQTISQTANGGTWRMTLPFVPINPEDKGLMTKVLTQLRTAANLNIMNAETAVGLSQSGMNSGMQDIYAYQYSDRRMEFLLKTVQTYEDGGARSTGNFFEWLLSANDVMFLAFDALKRGANTTDPEAYDLGSYQQSQAYAQNSRYQRGRTYDRTNFGADRTFDMIGLIDSVRTVTDPSSGNTFVEVNGRDLMKLLIEDGSFWFEQSVSGQQPNTIFANDSGGRQGDALGADKEAGYKGDPMKRLRWVSGEIDMFRSFINMDISFILKGVISRLANVEIVPDAVFESWGNRRTRFVELSVDTPNQTPNDMDR